MSFRTDKNGKMFHECEGVQGWDEIYVDHEGDWILSIDAGDGKTDIKYCPWCALELKVTT